ncbi:Mor transcription activator family protein [Metaclostridioides mangenotii]|uniref:Mor family transcriptional regulator n=1 Tax=Metaclostridioides mangenotii TaxID=1540 RepID=A0ABS4EBH7_9FIRM|nr:Mor transcription activator family protein [Clostridioides mangenotii]MBP1855285.1 Mor family transcriptional regulator [Clostridioides mangenotii]
MLVRLDDIPENFHAMIVVIGIEKFLELSKLYGGINMYIPIYSCIIREARNREIIEKYNGVNSNQLALKYGISSNSVKRIVRNISK